ncbi:TetR/AcrR family transcriptional regulator, partial [Acinetobacter baumannii]
PKEVLSARDQIAEHLAQFDWSSLTNGKRNVLQTFLTIASAQGYAAVTMRSLAKALNIKAPSIYSHFPDGKDDIVAEFLRWHYYNFGIAMLDVIDTIDDTEQLFNKMVNVHFTRQVTIPESELWDMLVASDRAGQF